MSAQVDEATVRQFLEIISTHARQVINGAGPKGVLQLCRINPIDESAVPSRFTLDDVDNMVRTAVGDALAGHNAYIEARTVRDDLRGNKRGSFEDTAWVFGLVADCDADKNKGGNITVRPSLVIETSPGNFHYWYLFTRAIPAAQAKLIGDAIRANSGTDQDTGVVTQCYRVPGTPNFPSAAKRARGRVAIEATRIAEQTGRLWDPDELLKAFSTASSAAPSAGAPIDDETTLPEELLKSIRDGGVGKTNDKSRSALFQSVIDQLKRRHWSIESIIALLEKYPNGVGAKYGKRLRKEVERSYGKAVGGTLGGLGAAPFAGPALGVAAASAAPQTAAASAAARAPHVLPTIRLVDGQLPRTVEATERAMVSTGMEIFSRAGALVYPASEARMAAKGRKTVTARLGAFSTDSFIEPVAEAGIFQRWSVRRKAWIDIDPPLQLVRMLLARERRWAFPHVSGIITTPTLRPDGSLLAAPGYDLRSELYLLPSLQMPPIAEHPTYQDAQAALEKLKDLFREFSFQDRQGDGLEKRLNRSVAISGLLTALLRGSLPTSPIYLVRADTPGTGKSYLVDVISMVTTGQYCPVITTSKNAEETEKRIGSVLLSGIPIVSLDNCIHDLGGELLCQLTERPVIRIRVLGRSEMPPCECHTTVFATGNNITFKGDMVRRGLVCNLEAFDERPELRDFERDALDIATADRGVYVAAGLTIVRAYLTAGSPKFCKPFGSYTAWSEMVRSPLVWLGEPDPVISMEGIRAEDAELGNICEFVSLWLESGLRLDTICQTAGIIEIACEPPPPGYWGPQPFKEFLLRIAAAKNSPATVSAERLGHWLRRISGRIVSVTDAQGVQRKYRLIREQGRSHRTGFKLVEI
jgi:RepB DNA-primase N-terminal domain